MKINCLPLGDIQTNCYLISTEKAALVIDPGFISKAVEDFLSENCDKERLILLTHAHFDHIGGACDLRAKTETKIAIGEFENASLSDKNVNLCNLFGADIKPFSADITLKDNQDFSVGDIYIKVFHTPGHTAGGVSYLIDNYLFSGDTLFLESIGRTDFPQGDFSVLFASVKRLYQLDDNISVFAGHGDKTTIAHEKMYNPFV